MVLSTRYAERPVPDATDAHLLSPGDSAAAQQMATTFRVLGDPSRVRLILVLLQHGEVSVGELARQTGITETACSHSLRLLRSERIVRTRRDGRSVLYSLDDDHIATLIDVARDHVLHADASH